MSELLTKLGSARALRAIVPLQPIDGDGGRVFPMTVERGRHVFEESPEGRRVLIDSCASQANRQGAALLAARQAGLLELSDFVVDLTGTRAVGRDSICTLEMPHRVADAILRDSEIDGVPFSQSEIGRRILDATLRDLTPIIETSPASLVFGTWFSQHKLGTWGLKIERASVSEIWGHGAQLGQSVVSRIDPLGLRDMEIFAAREGEWTPDPDQAVIEKGKAKLAPKREKTTKLNHANIPPSAIQRGVICERYEMRWSLSIAALRRLGFGGPSARDEAARRYLAALGLAARVLAHEDGYQLRSRCHLLASGPLTVEVIGRDGEIAGHRLDVEAALQLLRQAQSELTAAGFAPPRLIGALPSKRLVALIARSREVAAAAEAEAA